MKLTLAPLFFAFASAATADTGTACPSVEEACTGTVPLGTLDGCGIGESIVLEPGCDLNLEDYRVHLNEDATITIQSDASIFARKFTMDPRPGPGNTAGLTAECGIASCGELSIVVDEHATLMKTDLSANLPDKEGREGSSLRIVAGGPVVLADEILLGGRGNNGRGGDLFIEAPEIWVNSAIDASGKQAGYGGGTGGNITLHATDTIDIAASVPITTDGQRAGHIKIIAANRISVANGSTITSKMGDPSECANACEGTVKLDGHNITLDGTLDVALGDSGDTAAMGGHIWLQATDNIETGVTSSLRVGGGSDAASGTVRMDGNIISLSGDVYGRLDGAIPESGARFSIVARESLTVWEGATLDAGGDGAQGGEIDLIAGSVNIFGALDAGNGLAANIFIHSRTGNAQIAGSLTAFDTETPASEAHVGIRVDACRVVFNSAVSLTTAAGIDFIGRGDTGLSAWGTLGGFEGITVPMVGTQFVLRSPEEFLLPTDAQLSEFFGASSRPEGLETQTDSDLKGCGVGAPTDFDGDGESWERLGTGGAFTDCDDYDASVKTSGSEDVLGDDTDSDCACSEPSELPNAYAGFLYRLNQSIPVECDGDTTPGFDADGGPGDGGPGEDSVEPSDDTASGTEAEPSAFDTGLPAADPFEGSAVKGCSCASADSRAWPWLGALFAFGLVVRRRQ